MIDTLGATTVAGGISLAPGGPRRRLPGELPKRLRVGRSRDQRPSLDPSDSRERVGLLRRPRGLSSILEAQEEERRRIARDLHDVVGQSLAAARLGLVSMQERLARATDAAPDGVTADLDGAGPVGEAIAALDEALRSVRTFAIDLRPSILDDLGLAAAVRWVAGRFARDSGVSVVMDVTTAPFDIDCSVETACFRIVQEALTNIGRHAAAGLVSVSLSVDAGDLLLVVRDDGRGFDPADIERRARSGAHLGLVGMQERAAAAHGSLEIRSAPGRGTETRAVFPLRRAPQRDLTTASRTPGCSRPPS